MDIRASRPWVAGAAIVALAVSFGLGYTVRAIEHQHLAIYEASGYVGADVASFRVGDTTYGFRSSVAWTDRAGIEHTGGWPECLPRLQPVDGVRFGAAVVSHGTGREAVVLWVDCRS